ncbi:FAD binding domain-containing protein [Streptomyces rugosispiralis]|uniref:FAD binding domain-containing protein n=1 Tax=Streptomyces rugosispiralis TaxID=2967341 RepID=A0ABT1V8Q4_9ACTN|nr:FAD binding domain-containing protein [Streptomyces rugosispiralis]MCQ8193775.1 FAD binding domain-containing protein [Streptomyces rugosispiralis]
MTAVAFDYTAPTTVDEALRTLHSPGLTVTPLAGGQSLLPLLTRREVRPDLVVDLNGIPGLAGIEVSPHRVRIGAMTRLRDLEQHAELATALPVLASAAASVAHPHIRGRSTLGGSLCHAAPAAELPAVAVALGADVVLRSVRGARSVPAARFATGAGATVRAPDEVLTEVVFPRADGLAYEFSELGTRGSTGYPVVGVCLGLHVADGLVRAARVVVAGCGPVPVRLPGVEAELADRPVAGPHRGLVASVAAEVARGPGPEDQEYRTEAAGVLLLRALTARAAREGR